MSCCKACGDSGGSCASSRAPALLPPLGQLLQASGGELLMMDAYSGAAARYPEGTRFAVARPTAIDRARAAAWLGMPLTAEWVFVRLVGSNGAGWVRFARSA